MTPGRWQDRQVAISVSEGMRVPFYRPFDVVFLTELRVFECLGRCGCDEATSLEGENENGRVEFSVSVPVAGRPIGIQGNTIIVMTHTSDAKSSESITPSIIHKVDQKNSLKSCPKLILVRE